jgi:hypothetical protein
LVGSGARPLCSVKLESGIHCMRPAVNDSGLCAEHLALKEEERVREERAREEYRSRLSKGPPTDQVAERLENPDPYGKTGLSRLRTRHTPDEPSGDAYASYDMDGAPALTAALAHRVVKLEDEVVRLAKLVDRLCSKVNVSDGPVRPRQTVKRDGPAA